MMEIALKAELERLTGLPAYPIKRPDNVTDAITYQCISDPPIVEGLVRTRLINARYQITIWSTVSYQKARQIDNTLWQAWRTIEHGAIGSHPVQYIERLTRFNDMFEDANKQKIYMMSRDWRFFYPETD